MNEVLGEAIKAVIGYLGPTPVLLFLTIASVGDVAAIVWVVYKLNKMMTRIASDQAVHMTEVFARQDKRFEQVVRMYEDNVALVKNYERHVSNQRETNDKLIDLVAISTATQQQLVETSRSGNEAIMRMITNNEYCPYNRRGRFSASFEEGKG